MLYSDLPVLPTLSNPSASKDESPSVAPVMKRVSQMTLLGETLAQYKNNGGYWCFHNPFSI